MIRAGHRDLLIAVTASVAVHAAACIALRSVALAPVALPVRPMARGPIAVVLADPPEDEALPAAPTPAEAPAPEAPPPRTPASEPDPTHDRAVVAHAPPPVSDAPSAPAFSRPLILAGAGSPLMWEVLGTTMFGTNDVPPETRDADVTAPPTVANTTAPPPTEVDTPASLHAEVRPAPSSAAAPREPRVAPPARPVARVIPPQAIENEPPPYPRVARRREYEGTVDLRVHVLATGRCEAVEIERSSGYASLDRAAVRAARAWRFRPATRNGRAIDMWIDVPVQFNLREARPRFGT